MSTVCSPKFSSPAWNKTTAGVFQHTNTSLCNYYLGWKWRHPYQSIPCGKILWMILIQVVEQLIFWKMSFLQFRRARFSAIMPSWKDARLRFLTSSGVGWGVSRFPYVATSSANSAWRITLSFTNTSTILFTNFSFRFKYCQTHPTNHVMHNDPINHRFLNLWQLRNLNNKARKKICTSIARS